MKLENRLCRSGRVSATLFLSLLSRHKQRRGVKFRGQQQRGCNPGPETRYIRGPFRRVAAPRGHSRHVGRVYDALQRANREPRSRAVLASRGGTKGKGRGPVFTEAAAPIGYPIRPSPRISPRRGYANLVFRARDPRKTRRGGGVRPKEDIEDMTHVAEESRRRAPGRRVTYG